MQTVVRVLADELEDDAAIYVEFTYLDDELEGIEIQQGSDVIYVVSELWPRFVSELAGAAIREQER